MVNPTTYQDFLASKAIRVAPVGKAAGELHPSLFPFQADIVRWAVRKGRCAIFADTGLGKSRMQIEWAKQVGEKTLFLAPLAVTRQTVREAALMGYDLRYVRSQSEVNQETRLWITNYEMLGHFDTSQFQAVVIDESSILKDITGSTKKAIVTAFQNTPYRLACTATPAPNDVTELATHAEFLGIMTPYQMTSIFFVHDAGVFQGVKESRWRLKQHATQDFYRWLSSWAMAVKKPSDLGYEDADFILPELTTHLHKVHSDYTPPGMLPGVGVAQISATDLNKIRRSTLAQRMELVAALVNDDPDQWIIWTNLNEEAQALTRAIPGAVNVEGSQKPEVKADALEAFVAGKTRVLITKASVAGFGMNMQNCHKMVVFPSFSWEQYYQLVRRSYRFRQTQPVQVHLVISNQEESVVNTLQLKETEAMTMTQQLIEASRDFMLEELGRTNSATWHYNTSEASGQNWKLLLGDSCERMREIPDNSVHLSVYSPPFADMYVYNNTERDLSNCRDLSEFFEHYRFIIQENLRITIPGRIVCVHVQEPKTFKNKEGFRGIYDFTGQVISAYVEAGWIYRSRITIDKNPQIVASRNKDTDLLFVTGKRDSTGLAPMSTDYLLIFKKDGENPVPVQPYESGEMSEQDWILWARAVWYGIRETNVLNAAVAKAEGDEKHSCPLQLDLIERCVKLWSNKGETVFSPFAGIGSELYEAVRWGRQGLGIELKPEYFKTACRNLMIAETKKTQMTLFDLVPQETQEPAALPGEPVDFSAILGVPEENIVDQASKEVEITEEQHQAISAALHEEYASFIAGETMLPGEPVEALDILEDFGNHSLPVKSQETLSEAIRLMDALYTQDAQANQ